MSRRRAPVRLRYLWDSQTIIAVNARGDVLAAESIARLVVEAPRRKALVPPQSCGYEIDAIRDAVIARAHLAGQPAPRGWTRPMHGKDIDTSTPREDMAAAGDVAEQNSRRIKELEVGRVE